MQGFLKDLAYSGKPATDKLKTGATQEVSRMPAAPGNSLKDIRLPAVKKMGSRLEHLLWSLKKLRLNQLRLARLVHVFCHFIVGGCRATCDRDTFSRNFITIFKSRLISAPPVI